ncbi:hypothetical protein Q9K01_15125 [Qipengyuania sp. DY56-A-20]|jgi:hypothetical protein|uniref:Uncharacterized protein n=1 Tax=Qipengyuania benthica TaxID=3067651 RepID=A0ABT9HCA4_9SPHN|nr:hypothetical protein [Qipengyuania sp. DY56-A-20]MDP4540959.1 hypothetical protein [Qipengyuania sp. DY56-A-20]
MANDLYCTLVFDDLDLTSPDNWRSRMTKTFNDPTFGTLLEDLLVTGDAIRSGPVARDFGGGCDVRADVNSGGGWSAGVSCGIRF